MRSWKGPRSFGAAMTMYLAAGCWLEGEVCEERADLARPRISAPTSKKTPGISGPLNQTDSCLVGEASWSF